MALEKIREIKNMFSSIMRVYGNFDMPAEVKYHLNSRSGSNRLDRILASRKNSLKILRRLANNDAARQEIIKMGGIGWLVAHFWGDDGRYDVNQILRQSVLKNSRKLLGKLLFNNENLELLQLLLAAVKNNMEYDQVLFITKNDPTPVQIDKGTLVLQFNDDDATVYYSKLVGRERITIDSRRVDGITYEFLLPFKSLKKTEDKIVISKIINNCACYYDHTIPNDFSQVLARGVDEEYRAVVRDENGIRTILAFISESLSVGTGYIAAESIKYFTNQFKYYDNKKFYSTAFIKARGLETLSSFLTFDSGALKESLACLNELAVFEIWEGYEGRNSNVLASIIQLGIHSKIEGLCAVDKHLLTNTHFYGAVSYHYTVSGHSSGTPAEVILFKCGQWLSRAKKEAQEQVEKRAKQVAIERLQEEVLAKEAKLLAEQRRLKEQQEAAAKKTAERLAEERRIKERHEAEKKCKTDEEAKNAFDQLGSSSLGGVKFIPKSEIVFGRLLGAGSFGKVYEGTWKFQTVAVKCYEGERLPEVVAQEIRHEVGIMLRLQHDCLVKLLGLVQENSQPGMLVMELGENGSLYQYLRGSQTITWGLRLRMAGELARGLACLHDENIVHRDMKSLNVVLDGDYHAKWCDFGLAAMKQHSMTTSRANNASTVSIVGTIQWMAPELFERGSSKPSTKSDIWALGMVFFELASRQIPFHDAQTKEQVITWIMQGTGEVVPEECQARSPGFAAIIQRCWLERNSRPTAKQLIGEIAALPQL